MFSNIVQHNMSQEIINSNDGILNKFSISPAYAGSTGNYELFCTYRRNWTGFVNSPQKISLSLNGPLLNNSGLGINFMNNTYGIFNNISSSLAYSYFLKINNTQYVSFGTALLWEHKGISTSKISNKEFEPLLLDIDQQGGNNINGALGIVYSYKHFDAGVSIHNLFLQKVKILNRFQFDKQRSIKIHLSNLFTINNNLQILLASWIITTPVYNDPFYIFSKFTYKESIWASASWNSENVYSMGFGTIFKNRYAISYSYEYGLNSLNTVALGSHEITLGIFLFTSKSIKNRSLNFKSIFKNENKENSE